MIEYERTRLLSLQNLIKQDRLDAKREIRTKILNSFPFPKTIFYKWALRIAGIKLGNNVTFMGRVKFKIRGKPGNIIIGDNTIIGKKVDLRNRENGKIILKNSVYLDDNVRIVAAREGSVIIDTGVEIGSNTIINSGGITKIGKFVMIAGNVNINSSSHGIAKDKFIKEQSHIHGEVLIDNDVWIGSGVSIVMNTKIGEGAIIGANAVARGEIPAFAICVGVPAKVIKYRE